MATAPPPSPTLRLMPSPMLRRSSRRRRAVGWRTEGAAEPAAARATRRSAAAAKAPPQPPERDEQRRPPPPRSLLIRESEEVRLVSVAAAAHRKDARWGRGAAGEEEDGDGVAEGSPCGEETLPGKKRCKDWSLACQQRGDDVEKRDGGGVANVAKVGGGVANRRDHHGCEAVELEKELAIVTAELRGASSVTRPIGLPCRIGGGGALSKGANDAENASSEDSGVRGGCRRPGVAESGSTDTDAYVTRWGELKFFQVAAVKGGCVGVASAVTVAQSVCGFLEVPPGVTTKWGPAGGTEEFYAVELGRVFLLVRGGGKVEVQTGDHVAIPIGTEYCFENTSERPCRMAWFVPARRNSAPAHGGKVGSGPWQSRHLQHRPEGVDVLAHSHKRANAETPMTTQGVGNLERNQPQPQQRHSREPAEQVAPLGTTPPAQLAHVPPQHCELQTQPVDIDQRSQGMVVPKPSEDRKPGKTKAQEIDSRRGLPQERKARPLKRKPILSQQGTFKKVKTLQSTGNSSTPGESLSQNEPFEGRQSLEVSPDEALHMKSSERSQLCSSQLTLESRRTASEERADQEEKVRLTSGPQLPQLVKRDPEQVRVEASLSRGASQSEVDKRKVKGEELENSQSLQPSVQPAHGPPVQEDLKGGVKQCVPLQTPGGLPMKVDKPHVKPVKAEGGIPGPHLSENGLHWRRPRAELSQERQRGMEVKPMQATLGKRRRRQQTAQRLQPEPKTSRQEMVAPQPCLEAQRPQAGAVLPGMAEMNPLLKQPSTSHPQIQQPQLPRQPQPQSGEGQLREEAPKMQTRVHVGSRAALPEKQELEVSPLPYQSQKAVAVKALPQPNRCQQPSKRVKVDSVSHLKSPLHPPSQEPCELMPPTEQELQQPKVRRQKVRMLRNGELQQPKTEDQPKSAPRLGQSSRAPLLKGCTMKPIEDVRSERFSQSPHLEAVQSSKQSSLAQRSQVPCRQSPVTSQGLDDRLQPVVSQRVVGPIVGGGALTESAMHGVKADGLLGTGTGAVSSPEGGFVPIAPMQQQQLAQQKPQNGRQGQRTAPGQNLGGFGIGSRRDEEDAANGVVSESNAEDDSGSDTPQAKRIECDICHWRFLKRGNLNKHMRTVHGDGHREYRCDKCNLAFVERHNRDSHVKLVCGGAKPFSCDVCGARFGRKSSLRQHARTVHEKQRPWPCSFCGQAFGQKSTLAKHMRAVCGKAASAKPPVDRASN